MLAHHPAAEQAHHHEHHRVEAHRRQAQPGIDGEHGRQGEGIGQHRVGEAEHGKAHQAAHVFHIAGGPADQLATAGGLHPARFLQQQVVEDLLLEVGLHLPAHAENQHARVEAHRPHHAGQGDDQASLGQHIPQGEAVLQVIDHPPHQQRNRDAQQVHHHQGRCALQHLAAMGAQVAPDQVQPKGSHQGPGAQVGPT